MLYASIAHGGVFAIDPTAQIRHIGAIATISLIGLNFSETIEGGGINLSFDPSVLQIVDVNVDADTWEFATTPGIIDNTLGQLVDLTFSSFIGRSGDFPIAQITFSVSGIGVSPLNLAESILNPFYSNGEPLNPPVSFSSAEITAIPSPSVLWLWMSGVVGLCVFSKKIKGK